MTRAEMRIHLPIKTIPEANAREHWSSRARRRKKQRAYAMALCKSAFRGNPPILPCAVTLIRIAPRALDEGDNISASMKAIRDGVADALGTDDGVNGGITWLYAQTRGKPREYAVEVQINWQCEPRQKN